MMSNIERIHMKGGSGFTYTVIGDSMEPAFREGDIILMDRTTRAGRHDLVIIITGDPAMPLFGRLAIEGDTWLLKFLNPRYSTIKISRSELLGVVTRWTEPPTPDEAEPDAAA